MFVTICVPKYKPHKFKQISSVYLGLLFEGVPGDVDVRILGLQGEDTGTGVHTSITWLSQANDKTFKNFIEKKVKNDFADVFQDRFFGAVHIEGFTDSCLVYQNGSDASGIPGLVPTLHTSLALQDRAPTEKNAIKYGKKLVRCLERYLEKKGGNAIIRTDWFVDNDAKLGDHKSKPVINLSIQGPSLQTLKNLSDIIYKIGRRKLSQSVLFPRSRRIGYVHVEGGTMIPRVCYAKPEEQLVETAPKIMALDYDRVSNRAVVVVKEPSTGEPPFTLTSTAYDTKGNADVTCPCLKFKKNETTMSRKLLDTLRQEDTETFQVCSFTKEPYVLKDGKSYSFEVNGEDASGTPLPGATSVENPEEEEVIQQFEPIIQLVKPELSPPVPDTTPSPADDATPSPPDSPPPDSPPPPPPPCTVPSAPTISSVNATSFSELSIAWSAISGATGYQYWCVSDTGSETCSSTIEGGGSKMNTTSTSGSFGGLTQSTSYTCYVSASDSCGSSFCSLGGTASTSCGSPPSAPVISSVLSPSAGKLEVSWNNVAGATYEYWCVLVTGSESCGSSIAGGSKTTTSSTSGEVRGLQNGTEYICYVTSTVSGCTSTCSTGKTGATMPDGISSILSVSGITSFIVDDGEDPSGDPLPLEKRPERANTSCTEINEFPDKLDPAEGRRAMQIILDLGAWDKPSFEASLGAQGLLFKSLADSIASRNIYNTAMRMFNVDNSEHGAGPKIRIWFQSQQDCIDYATYIKGLRDTPSLGSYPNGALMDSYVSTSDFGTVRIRMVTNPQSKCHKWKLPSSVVAQSQLTNYIPPSASLPSSPNLGTDPLCESYEDPGDTEASGANNWAAHQVIVSLSGWTKTSYQNDASVGENMVRAWRRFFESATGGNLKDSQIKQVTLQVKALDNSAAGVGLHLRFFYVANLKSYCDDFAVNVWPYGKPTDADFDTADNLLQASVFGPQASAMSFANYFGTAVRRATMRTCKQFTSGEPPATVGGTPAIGQIGWVGTLDAVSL